MRPTGILMAVLALALQACMPSDGGGPSTPEGGVAGAPIDVTALDGVPAAVTDAAAKPAPMLDPAMEDRLKPAMVDAAADSVPLSPQAPAPEAAAATEAPPPVVEAVPLAPPVPEVLKSRDQLKCEKGGGLWESTGKSKSSSCVRRTRDGGKACESESDCQGQCLARSKTCAPFDPLFGCNEVLQKDGSRVTLCLD